MMEHDILYYHTIMQKHIHIVEVDETNEEALSMVKESFLKVFDMLKMILISRQERYYGCFLMNFDLCIDFTAYYDAGVNLDAFPFRMIINPLLIGVHSLPEMAYIICHEIEHIVLNHPVDGIKYNPGKDPAIGLKLNIAMDASINDRLTMDSTAKNFRVISEPDEAITSTFLREHLKIRLKELQAFDYYFERIPDKGRSGDSGIIIVQGDMNKYGEIITDPKRRGMVCIHSWSICDDPDEIASIIRKFMLDACDAMPEKMRSELPEHQKDALANMLSSPVVSWKQLLKRFVGTIPDGHRKTRTRLSRRQPLRYDISGSMSDRIIKLIVAIDTSGSMTTEDLERIFAEIFDIIGSRLCEVTIIECDAGIQRVYKARSVRDVSFEIKGRGGTSFVPVINYINNNRQLRDAILIYFTDGMGDRSIPRPLTFRTMWVLLDKNCELSVRNPYGEILTMD